MAKITDKDVLDARDKMLELGTLSTTSINDIMDLFGAVCRYAVDEGYMEKKLQTLQLHSRNYCLTSPRM